jgi:hypothetical protein
MAWALDAQADMMLLHSPVNPLRMQIMAGAALAIITGIVSGETACGPIVPRTSYCFSRISMLPIAEPVITATRSRS